jgi:YHS domain-containing protein
MASLERFSRLIDERIAAIARQREWTTAQANEYMTELAKRQLEFVAIATKVLTSVIQPRVEVLAAHFPNAGPVKLDRGQACVCWFGYCERFPASTELRLTVAHDDTIENAEVVYEVRILPAFLKYDRFDKLVLPLTHVDERACDWVETKLLGFLDSYLAIETADHLQPTSLATDPVCGMRLTKVSTTLRHDYRGHPYYFCSHECRDAFAADPRRFVWFETV